jgi:hypothetical protein
MDESETTKEGKIAVCPICGGGARYQKDESGLLLLCARDMKHNFRLIEVDRPS